MEKFQPLYNDYGCTLTDEQTKRAVADILEKEFDANNNVEVWKRCFNSIDLTKLNTTDTVEGIAAWVEKVNMFPIDYPQMPSVAALCVYPSMVETAVNTLEIELPVASVCACFPSSQTFIEAKVAETALTVAAGASEIDVVMSVGTYLSGRHTEVSDELIELKSACRNAHLKVILETGSLPSMKDVQQASVIAMCSGADFIKTSTGKTSPAATLEAAYAMCTAIKAYYEKTGRRVGFKPAGGISTTEEAVQYYSIVKAVLGDEWLNNRLFRIGASRLANNLLTSILGKEVKYF